MSSVTVQVLHRLPDEGMGDERPAGELRVSEIETRIENRNFDPVPVEVAARDFARGETPRHAQNFRRDLPRYF